MTNLQIPFIHLHYFYTSPLFQTIDAIGSFLGIHILAKNKKNKTATLINIVTFQVEKTTMLEGISYELANRYNFQRQDKSEIVFSQAEPNDNIHPNSNPSIC